MRGVRACLSLLHACGKNRRGLPRRLMRPGFGSLTVLGRSRDSGWVRSCGRRLRRPPHASRREASFACRISAVTTHRHTYAHTRTRTRTFTTCVHARTPLQKYRGECSLFACEPVAQVICCVHWHGRRICACLWPAIRDRQARAGIASPWRCAHAQGATHPVQLNPHGVSSRGGRRILCCVTLSRAEA